ncbi:MAG: putative RNA-binding protein (virulence factor B family) [Aureispira sp.]|jgi:predicted RNA-binding protein (virulence factor B family)
MIELGKYNLLEVMRSTPHGLFLEDKEENDVLLPGKFIPEGTAVGDYLEVYIYRDNEERLVATTEEPKFTLYEFAGLKVSDVNAHGAFVDYGVGKDLFVPFREQRIDMVEGNYYLVYMYLDGETDRLAGSTKIEQFLDLVDLEEEELAVGDEVTIIVWGKSELGTNVIVNNRYKGLIYANELFEDLTVGMPRTAYINRVREDGKLDIRLEKDGYAKVEDNAQKILDLLKERKGLLLLTDKSSPDLIKKELGMSKKTFKKSIGALYRQKIILLEEKGIRLA